jgi:RimJ/RimL family protein N-acetyltransferase
MHNQNDRRFRRDPRTSPMTDRSREFFPAGLAAGLFGGPQRSSRCSQRADALPSGEVIAETRRLILRRHAATDFPAYFAMSADREMARFSGLEPADSDEAWERLLRHAGNWSLFGYGFVALEEKATGCFVGEAGLAQFKRGLGSGFDGVPEAGWAIAPWAQRHGYATEAAAAALAWIEAGFGFRRSVCVIHAENAASIRVAEKLGYTPFGQCTYRGYCAITFERLRP